MGDYVTIYKVWTCLNQNYMGAYMFEYKITDADIIGGNKNLLKDVTRYASRGLLVDDNNIALMHMPKNGYYKLPGGGLEEFETPEMAFVREVKEETGYSLTSVKLFGNIEEHKTHNNFLQYSYCFYAKQGTEESNKKLTDNEKELGLRVVWIS